MVSLFTLDSLAIRLVEALAHTLLLEETLACILQEEAIPAHSSPRHPRLRILGEAIPVRTRLLEAILVIPTILLRDSREEGFICTTLAFPTIHLR